MIIAGVGTAVPEYSVSQESAAAIATTMCDFDQAQSDRIKKLYRLTRVDKRHSVLLNDNRGLHESQTFFESANGGSSLGPSLSARMNRYERHAPELAIQAATKALADADTAPESITHLITVSCSGFVAPGIDVALIKQLGLPATTQRTHVGFMGCHGAMNGLRVARGFVESDPEAIVLLVAVEICSVHYQFSTEDETNLANGLFSDGAGAVVARKEKGNEASGWSLVATGSCMLPDSEAAMTWKVRDHGFQMTLGREVPALIHTYLQAWLAGWLATHGLTPKDIATWAIHPGGPAILQSVRTSLALSNDDLWASWDVLGDFGNMSSPTILFVIERLRTAATHPPCVALGFGPGLAVEALLFR